MKFSAGSKNQEVRLTIDARKLWDGGIGRYLRGLVVGLMGLPEFAEDDASNRVAGEEGGLTARWRLTVLLKSDAQVPPEWREFASEAPSGVPERSGQAGCPSGASSSNEASPPNKASRSNRYSRLNSSRINIVRCDLAPYSTKELLRFPAGRSDLVHIPHFTLPLRLPCPAVVTIHDLIHLEAPERWYYPLIAYPMLAHAVRGSQEVITVSEASRQALVKRFPKVEGKVTVVPNPLLCSLPDAGASSSSSITQAPAPHSSLPQQDFLLAIFSTNKPHKRLKQLLDAYAHAVRTASSTPAPLCICGQGLSHLVSSHLSAGAEPGVEPHASSSATSYSLPPGVINLGVLSEADLQTAYARAKAVIIPSALEGFGFALVEAHRHGTPVIMTPVPALKELAELGDTILPDFSDAALSAAIIDTSRAPKVNISVDLSRFNPQEVARLTMQVYRKALGGEGGNLRFERS